MINLVKDKLEKMDPGYLLEFEDLIKSISQFGGGAEGDKYTYAKSFSNVYELYVYSFYLGLSRKERFPISVEDKLKSFWRMDNWKPKELTMQLIACAIAETEDFELIHVEQLDESELRVEVKKVLNTIEEFANGGLQIINTELKDNIDALEDELFFVRLLG